MTQDKGFSISAGKLSGDGKDSGLVAPNGSSMVSIDSVTCDLQMEGVSRDAISTATMVGSYLMRRAAAETVAGQWE